MSGSARYPEYRLAGFSPLSHRIIINSGGEGGGMIGMGLNPIGPSSLKPPKYFVPLQKLLIGSRRNRCAVSVH